MNQYLVVELSTGATFQTGAESEEAALKQVSLKEEGSVAHANLFKAMKLIEVPMRTVARLKLFDRTKS